MKDLERQRLNFWAKKARIKLVDCLERLLVCQAISLKNSQKISKKLEKAGIILLHGLCEM